MCGISGIYNHLGKPLDSNNIIAKIIKIQDLRGPDNNGVWESSCKKIYFGHNRLSIIDLTNRASQPFVSLDKRYTITFNGEIYNYKELKKELINNNINFKSDSDTEVIIESYKYWGVDFIKKLRGMFAFAIWDNQGKKLLLARDPFGIKPLYYSIKNDILYFASQIKSLLSINNLSFEKSGKSIFDYYLWGNITEPFTLYKDIFSLEKGTIKIFDIDFKETNYKYANLKETIINSKNKEFKNKLELNEKLKFLVKETADYHQVSDVSVTHLLSSGIDSNVLLAASNKDKNITLNALTIDFSEKLKESPLAEKSSKLNKIDHIIEKISDNHIQELISKYYQFMDSPTNDGLNNFLVSHFAKKNGSKVLISGIGGDELFFGYPSFKNIPNMKKFSNLIPKNKKFRECLYNFFYKLLFKLDQNTKYAGIFKYSHDTLKSYMLQRCVFMPDEIGDLVNKKIIDDKVSEMELRHEIDKKEFENEKIQVMYYEIEYYLCSKLLRDADWTSMANSVELRTPFVDWFFFKELLPILKSNIKISKKNLLDCFKESTPEELYNRKKTGFTIPYKQYFKKISGKKNIYSNPIKDWSLLSYENYKHH